MTTVDNSVCTSLRFFFAYKLRTPRRGKLDLDKIRASLNTPCPHCGHNITPEERTHVDTEHLECPQCHRRFIPGGEKPISTS